MGGKLGEAAKAVQRPEAWLHMVLAYAQSSAEARLLCTSAIRCLKQNPAASHIILTLIA